MKNTDNCLRVFLFFLVLLTATAPTTLAGEAVLIRGATVWTQSDAGILSTTDLLVVDGKIAEIGLALSAPRGAIIIDAVGKHVTPGLIDCHSHTAIRGGVNEGSNNITAEVRIEDVVNPEDRNIYRQLAGGLTTAHLLHGSANSIGGQDAIIKLRWQSGRDELLLDGAAPGIKFALGENPKRSNFRRPGVPQRYPASRMGVMESIRDTFAAAQDYRAGWDRYEALSSAQQVRKEPPRRDLQLEPIAEIIAGERLVHSHSYRQDEILALIRVADQFNFTIGTFQHVLEGYKVADELAIHGAGASTFSDWWAYKLEAYDAIPFNGALMHERGVLVTFNSDSAELARRMNLEAAKAVKYGELEAQAALDFVTLNAARQLGVDDRIGSLEVGKDADFVIWSRDPLSVYAVAEQTWVDGTRQFDRESDLAAREIVENERLKLIREIRGDKAAAKDSKEPQSKFESWDAQRSTLQLGYLDPLATRGGAVSLTHARIHTMAGEIIENGTLSFRNGRIVELGAGLPPLNDDTVQIIDLDGHDVYPGFIDVNTAVGLTEISAVPGSVDTGETGEMNPNIHTAISVNPDSELIPVTRANGITHVAVVPSGGRISGRSALMRLDGWTWEDLTAVPNLAMHIRWPSFRTFPPRRPDAPSEEDQKKQREDQLEALQKIFRDARAYLLARDGNDETPWNPRLEALRPVLEGRQRVVIHASRVKQIESALDWAREEELRVVIAGSGDLWRVADRLHEQQVAVVLTSVLSLPLREDEPYDTRYTEAAKLAAAGVSFCFAGSGGSFAAANTRNLPYHAAMAVAFGLPREEALRALTRYPAEIFGFDEHLGTLEVGKSASLIVTDGDPLEIRTRVIRAFIDGRSVDLAANKHERLYRRYRGRGRRG